MDGHDTEIGFSGHQYFFMCSAGDVSLSMGTYLLEADAVEAARLHEIGITVDREPVTITGPIVEGFIFEPLELLSCLDRGVGT